MKGKPQLEMSSGIPSPRRWQRRQCRGGVLLLLHGVVLLLLPSDPRAPTISDLVVPQHVNNTDRKEVDQYIYDQRMKRQTKSKQYK